MPRSTTVDTALDDRGLRRVDLNGHLIYWPGAEPGHDYQRSGLNGGICTAFELWDQDAATSRNANPGRLRHREGESPLLGGVGFMRAEWLAVPGQPTKVSTEV